MPVATHVIRGNVARLLRGQWRWLIAGNSIHSPSNTYNVTQALFKNAPTAVLGGVVGFVPGTGMPTSGLIATGAGMTISTARPGEDLSSGSNGANLRITQVATGNANAFAPLPRILSNDAASPSGIWNENKQIKATWFLESNAGGTGYWISNTDAWTHFQANRISSASGHPYSAFIINPNLLASPNQLIIRETPFYANQSGANTLLGYLQSNNSTETGTLKPLACAMETNDAVGVFGGFAGHGSWPLEAHASETGALITADAPSYQARYTDAALIAEMQALRYNCIILCPGANETDFAIIETQILRVIERYRRCALAAGLPAPCFLLVTQYDALADDTTTWDLARNACIKIARSRPDTECVDFGGWQRDTYGLWSSWRVAQLSDLIHPATANSTLRTNWANLIYSQVNQINYGGGGLFPGFLGTPPAWLGR